MMVGIRRGFFTVILLLLSFVVFVFTTGTGLSLVHKVVHNVAHPAVSIGNVEGRLSGSWSADKLKIIVPGVRIEAEKLEVDWRLLRLFLGELRVEKISAQDLNVTLITSQDQKQPEQTAGSKNFALPLSLHLGELQVENFAFRNVEGSVLLPLDLIQIGLEANHHNLTVNELNLQGPDMGLSLHGSVDTRGEILLDVLGKWRLVGFGFHEMGGNLSAKGQLDELAVTASITNPADIRVEGTLFDVLENPRWEAILDASGVDLSSWIKHCPQIILQAVHGDLNGDFGNYRGRVVAHGEWGVFDELRLTSDLDGNGLGIDFQTLRIDRKDGYATGDGGSISWADLFSWQAQVAVHNFDPSVLVDNLTGRISGNIDTMGDVQEEGLTSSYSLTNVIAKLNNQPLAVKGELQISEDGIFTDGLRFESRNVTGIALVNSAKFMWDETSAWALAMRLEDFNPGLFHNYLEGSVSGNVDGLGGWNQSGFEGSVTVDSVSGQLLGGELSGGGVINVSPDSMQSTGFSLHVGESFLHVQGVAASELGLEIELFAPDLQALWPDLGGSLQVNGKVAGELQRPIVDIDGKATNVQYGDFEVGEVTSSVTSTLSEEVVLRGNFVASNYSAFGVEGTKAEVNVEGAVAQHILEGSIETDIGSLNLQLVGGYQKSWQGTVEGLAVDGKRFGNWNLRKPADLFADGERLSVADFCLEGKNTSLCSSATVGFSEELHWSATASVPKLSLELLSDYELINVPVRGSLSGDFSAEGTSTQISKASAELNVPKASFQLEVEESGIGVVQFVDSHLTADLQSKIVKVETEVKDQNGGKLQINGQLHGVGDFSSDLTTTPIEGRIEIDHFQLDLLALYTVYGVEPTGWLSSSLFFEGTVGSPRLYGDVFLREGGVELPYQGIRLTDISLALEAMYDGAQVEARATSDEGVLVADGKIHFGAKPLGGNLDISGQDFLLVNLPEYAIRINPDVKFVFSREKGEIKGKVEIPYGVIAPEELSNSVSVSEDVMLVNQPGSKNGNGWPFYLDLAVVLGDDVTIDGYGLKGNLGGGLNVTITPADFITGTGELDLLGGSFTTYGRTLDIERGRVLFTGGPIDNPGLDVRAQISVSDSEARGEGYTVGVDISGLVQDLQFNLFSDPFMEDTEILSLLIVGHSLAGSTEAEGNLLKSAATSLGLSSSSVLMEGLGELFLLDDLHLEGTTEEGDVSVVVGKRITQDLYIGYDMNMFSQLGQFRVRYDLDKGFWVETRSSSESTGADLMYSFER